MQPGLRRKQLTGQFTIVCALPLYHVFAFIACGLLGMRTGALNILIPNPRDMEGTVKELAKYRINIFPGVNTLFNGLVNRADFAKLDFSGLAISNPNPSRIFRTLVTCCAFDWASLPGPIQSESSMPTRTLPPIAAAWAATRI